jgi:hypothetical protein
MNKNIQISRILSILGAVLIIVSIFTPIWWVALQSRQYPKSMYPEGIRINFKFTGVYNGCEGVREREELAMDAEGADCLVEMNAINHFIGMYHITQGLNRDESRPYPIYYVFDTKKDENGNEITDPETGKPIEIDVTPSFLKFLDSLMRYSPYLLGFFALSGLAFGFTSKRLNIVLAIIPGLIPIYFLVMYIIGLYWYGHNLGLHGGGAFEGIKPFMPTVFGEGKVAQFTTQSYPYYGFFILIAILAIYVFEILFKRKGLNEQTNN